MKTKNFWELAEKRLGKDQVVEIKKEAELEVEILRSMQNFISSSLEEYMSENKVGFNELVEKLGSSPSHLAKIKKGQANLTIGSFAHLMATLGKDPVDMFKPKK